MGKGTIYHIISHAAFLVGSYAIHISMAYLFADPRDYGTLGVMLSLISLMRVFLSTGLPQATSHFVAQDEDHAYAILRTSTWIQLSAALVLGVVYVGAIPLWTSLLKDDSLTPYILLSALLIPLMGAHQINMAYFNGRRKFGNHAFFVGLYSVGRAVFAIGLVLLGMRIGGVLLGLILAAAMAIVFEWTLVERVRDEFRPDIGRLLRFAYPLILMSIGLSFLVNLDILMLKHFFPDSDMIGFYAGGMNLGKAPYFIFAAFAITALPTISKALADEDDERAQRLVTRNLSLLLFLSVPTAAMVLATPEALLGLIYPDAYAAAARPLGILVVSMTLLAGLASMTSMITAKGLPKVSMGIVSVCIPIQIGLGLVLIPRYEMMGAAYANLITVVVGAVLASSLVLKHYGVLFHYSHAGKVVIVSAILFAGLHSVPEFPVWWLPGVYAICFALYGGVMLLIDGVTRDEFRKLRGMFSG